MADGFKAGDRVRHKVKKLQGTIVSECRPPGAIFGDLTYAVKWDGEFPPEPQIRADELELIR